MNTKTNVYLDIETVTTGDEEIRHHVYQKGLNNYSKKTDKDKFDFDEYEKAGEKEVAMMPLNAAFGEIASIAVATNDNEPKVYFRQDKSKESEFEMLKLFFADYSKVPAYSVLIGHNLKDFDRLFIWRRAMVHGLVAPRVFSAEIKPWENEIVQDTMHMWAKGQFGQSMSLDDLCLAFAIQGKGAVCGSDVARLWEECKYKEIADYNIDDVKITRNLYKKMELLWR